MRLSFRSVSTVAAAVCFALAVVWMLAPQVLLQVWTVSFSGAVGLVARRGAALFLGIGVALFRCRNAEASTARNALASGVVVSCAALAALGVIELAVGHAGAGILLAVVVEVSLAAAFSLTYEPLVVPNA